METPECIRGYLQASAGFGVSGLSSGFRPYFAVYADDELVVDALMLFFSAGAKYRNRARLLFRIVKTAELMAVVAQCDAHPLIGEKAKRFTLWRELVLAKNGLGDQTAERVDEVVKSLSNKKL